MGVYRSTLAAELDEITVPAVVCLTLEELAVNRRYGLLLHPTIPVRLVVDNGSRYCSLTPAVLQQLKPRSEGQFLLQGPLAEQSVEHFSVRLEFPTAGLQPVDNLKVVSLPMPPKFGGAYQGIIGRDLLRHWYFYHAGPRRRFTIRDRPSLWTWLCS